MERRAAERSSERDRDGGSNPADPPNVSAGPREARRPVGVAARGCYFGEAPHRIGAEPPRPEPSCDRRGLFEAGERAVEIALELLEPAENSRERLAPIFGRWGPSG